MKSKFFRSALRVYAHVGVQFSSFAGCSRRESSLGKKRGGCRMYGWIEAALSLWTNRKRLCFVSDAVVTCVPNGKPAARFSTPATHTLILCPMMVHVVKLSVLTRTCLPQMNCINALRTRCTARNSNALIQYPVSQGGSQTPQTTLSSQSVTDSAGPRFCIFSSCVRLVFTVCCSF